MRSLGGCWASCQSSASVCSPQRHRQPAACAQVLRRHFTPQFLGLIQARWLLNNMCCRARLQEAMVPDAVPSQDVCRQQGRQPVICSLTGIWACACPLPNSSTPCNRPGCQMPGSRATLRTAGRNHSPGSTAGSGASVPQACADRCVANPAPPRHACRRELPGCLGCLQGLRLMLMWT